MLSTAESQHLCLINTSSCWQNLTTSPVSQPWYLQNYNRSRNQSDLFATIILQIYTITRPVYFHLHVLKQLDSIHTVLLISKYICKHTKTLSYPKSIKLLDMMQVNFRRKKINVWRYIDVHNFNKIHILRADTACKRHKRMPNYSRVRTARIIVYHLHLTSYRDIYIAGFISLNSIDCNLDLI